MLAFFCCLEITSHNEVMFKGIRSLDGAYSV